MLKRQRIMPTNWWDSAKRYAAQTGILLRDRVAEERHRLAAITAEASVGVPQRRLGVTGLD